MSRPRSVRRLDRHDERNKPPSIDDRIELHVFGRTNNAYRWSGESDVFEALDSVKKRYKIDAKRIVFNIVQRDGESAAPTGPPNLPPTISAFA